MTRDDIIRMAKEAGFDSLLPSEEILGRGRIYTGSDDEISDELERFAALVAAAERSACAQVCDEIANKPSNVVLGVALDCAAAIRARGEK